MANCRDTAMKEVQVARDTSLQCLGEIGPMPASVGSLLHSNHKDWISSDAEERERDGTVPQYDLKLFS